MQTVQSIIIEIATQTNPFKKKLVTQRCDELGIKCTQYTFEHTVADMGGFKPKYAYYQIPQHWIDGTQPTEPVDTTKSVTTPVETVVEETVVESTTEDNTTKNRWVPVVDQVDHELFQEELIAKQLSLKEIVLRNQKCFSKFYADNTCKACPLAGSCQQALFAKVEAWADEMVQAEQVANAPKVEEPVVVVEPKVDLSNTLTVDFTTICSKCEMAIPANTPFVNQVGVGNLHPHCV